MVPSSLYSTNVFPRLPNGKIDTSTLMNSLDTYSLSNTEVSELSELEESVLSIVRKILNKNEVVVSDGFVANGGDSITAMRFCAQLQHDYSLRIPIRQLFESDSIRQFCQLIELSLQARNVNNLDLDVLDSFESGEI